MTWRACTGRVSNGSKESQRVRSLVCKNQGMPFDVVLSEKSLSELPRYRAAGTSLELYTGWKYAVRILGR